MMMRKVPFLFIVLFAMLFVSVFVTGTSQVSSDDRVFDSSTGDVYYFYGESCPHCAGVKPFVDELEKYGLSVHRFEVYSNRSSLKLLQEYFDRFYVPVGKRGVPVVFTSNSFFVGSGNIIDGFRNLGSSNSEVKSESVGPASDAEESGEVEGLSLLTITVAALADSINPCSMAILFFLMAGLLLLRRHKRALKIGLAFTLSALTANLLFGLGIFTTIAISSLSSIFKVAAGLIAVLTGTLLLKECFFYRKGRFVMEVPHSLKPYLKHRLSQAFFGKNSGPIAAFFAGFVVSFFEIPCTGGPYLYVLARMADKATIAQTYPMLLYYNLIFVSPLVLITVLLYFGSIHVEKAREWMDGNKPMINLTRGLMMIEIGLATIPIQQTVQTLTVALTIYRLILVPVATVAVSFIIYRIFSNSANRVKALRLMTLTTSAAMLLVATITSLQIGSLAVTNTNFYVSNTDVQENSPSPVNRNNNFTMICNYTVASTGSGKKLASNFYIYYQYNSTTQGWTTITNDANFEINDTHTGPYSTETTTGTYSDTRTRSILAKSVGTYWVRCQIENTYISPPAQRFVNSSAYSQNVTYVYLEVNLSTPSPITCTESTPCEWNRNELYWINASVKCLGTGKSCGDVSGSARYNVSSANPDTLISSTKGATPFYVVEPRDTSLSWENVSNYSPGEDSVRRIATDSQGNIIAVGWDSISSTFDWRVVKYNSTGSMLWENTSANARANGVAVDSQDNIIVVGYTGSGSTSKWKIVKFSPAGLVLWENLTLYTGGGGAWAVATDSQDDLIVGGLDNAPGNYEWHIVKYSSAGSMLWENVTNFGAAGDEIFGVATDSQDNIIVGGFTSDTAGGSDQWRTIKYDSTGSTLWENATDYSSGNDIIRDVTVDSQDNIVVVGDEGILGNSDWRIVKFNPTGSVLWETATDYTGTNDIAYGVAVDTQDNIIVTGENNFAVGEDAWWRVVKYNSTGSILWENITNPTTGWDRVYDVTTDLEDSIVLGGYDSSFGDEWRIMKFSLLGVNPQICGSMSRGDICQLNWVVDAVGNAGEVYRIDVSFSSSYLQVQSNNTNDSFVEITTAALLGDLNDDCFVDILDLRIVSREFGSTSSSPNWNSVADLNQDGKIDVLDLSIVGKSFGKSCY